MLGSHGQRLKRKPWEESIRVPGILRYPRRIKPGLKSDALLTHVDLAPTLLALCGLPVPDEMQGTDMSGVLLGQNTPGPVSAFFQIFVPFAGDVTPRPWRGVRTHRYMYARTQAGPWLLYDLQEDPFELRNLVNDAAHDSVRKTMDARLTVWMSRTGDTWANDSLAPVEDDGRLYRSRPFYTIREYLDWAAEHPEVAPAK
jgi:arylsulfatase A-like enzyme